MIQLKNDRRRWCFPFVACNRLSMKLTLPISQMSADRMNEQEHWTPNTWTVYNCCCRYSSAWHVVCIFGSMFVGAFKSIELYRIMISFIAVLSHFSFDLFGNRSFCDRLAVIAHACGWPTLFRTQFARRAADVANSNGHRRCSFHNTDIGWTDAGVDDRLPLMIPLIKSQGKNTKWQMQSLLCASARSFLKFQNA